MLDDALQTVVERRTGEKFKSKLFISVLAGVSLDALHVVSKTNLV